MNGAPTDHQYENAEEARLANEVASRIEAMANQELLFRAFKHMEELGRIIMDSYPPGRCTCFGCTFDDLEKSIEHFRESCVSGIAREDAYHLAAIIGLTMLKKERLIALHKEILERGEREGPELLRQLADRLEGKTDADIS